MQKKRKNLICTSFKEYNMQIRLKKRNAKVFNKTSQLKIEIIPDQQTT